LREHVLDLEPATEPEPSQVNPKFPLNREPGGEFGGCLSALLAEKPSTPLSSNRRFGLIDEFSTEFVADPPCQPALAGVARRQDDGEFRG
jgi:hypothetical protein